MAAGRIQAKGLTPGGEDVASPMGGETTESGPVDHVIQPTRFLTTEDIAALWNERCRQVDIYRRTHPDDIRGIELRQHQASAALQAYRLLSMLEHQLGYQLALPILGPLSPSSRPQ